MTPKFKAEIPRVLADKTHDLTPSMRCILTEVHEQMMEPEQRIAPMAIAMQICRMKQAVTLHGFRSVFRDWAAQCTGYSQEVTEIALAHIIGNAVEQADRRGDLFEMQRQLMADWTTYCASGAPASGKVPRISGEAA